MNCKIKKGIGWSLISMLVLAGIACWIYNTYWMFKNGWEEGAIWLGSILVLFLAIFGLIRLIVWCFDSCD